MSRSIRIPRVVGQQTAILPDGSVDTASVTDCGESCLSSALYTQTGLYFSPGCIRQAMGLPEDNGVSNAVELVSFLTAMGVNAHVSYTMPIHAWEDLAHLRHHGQYAIILGHWDGPELHWVLAFQRGAQRVWVMDPWTAAHRSINRDEFSNLYAGSLVTIHYSK